MFTVRVLSQVRGWFTWAYTNTLDEAHDEASLALSEGYVAVILDRKGKEVEV